MSRLEYLRFFSVFGQTCGGNITAMKGRIISPLSYYEPPLNCIWTIQGTENQVVELHFWHLSMEDHPDCRYGFVSVGFQPPLSSVLNLGQ